jgi:hypothetical protein
MANRAIVIIDDFTKGRGFVVGVKEGPPVAGHVCVTARPEIAISVEIP